MLSAPVTLLRCLSGQSRRFLSTTSRLSGRIALAQHEKMDGVFTLTIDNAKKKNSLSFDLIGQMGDQLRRAASDSNCRVLMWTGSEDVFCAGLDLADFVAKSHCLEDDVDEVTRARDCKAMSDKVQYMVEGLIDFPKPIIACVNGPAIGIGVTALGLCDLVLVQKSPRVFFSAPFSSLGFVTEGCSSYTFPVILGPHLASDVLIFGRKLDAKEAFEAGLANRLIDSDNFMQGCEPFAAFIANAPPSYMKAAKGILRKRHAEALRKASREEMDAIALRWQSKEVSDAMRNFLNRKK